MKYAITREDGGIEIREDSYPLRDDVVLLSDEQYDQLVSGMYIMENGKIVTNPKHPMFLFSS